MRTPPRVCKRNGVCATAYHAQQRKEKNFTERSGIGNMNGCTLVQPLQMWSPVSELQTSSQMCYHSYRVFLFHTHILYTTADKFNKYFHLNSCYSHIRLEQYHVCLCWLHTSKDLYPEAGSCSQVIWLFSQTLKPDRQLSQQPTGPKQQSLCKTLKVLTGATAALAATVWCLL